jgi:hypothetical protein
MQRLAREQGVHTLSTAQFVFLCHAEYGAATFPWKKYYLSFDNFL